MRFLIEQPVSPRLADWLRSIGHDAYHVREQGLSRFSDEELFARATSERGVVVDRHSMRIAPLPLVPHPPSKGE